MYTGAIPGRNGEWNGMKKRLIVTYLAIVLVTLFASQVSLWMRGQAFLEEQSASQYLDRARLIGELLEEKGFSGENTLQDYIEAYAEEENIRLTVIAADGTVLVDSQGDASRMENHRGREEVQEALAGKSASVVRHSATFGIDYCYCAVPMEGNGFSGVLRIAVPMEEFQNLRAEYIESTLLITAIGLILIIGMVMAFARFIAAPIEGVAKAAEKLAGGDYSVRIPAAGPIQVGNLGDSFNRMAGQMERTMHDLKNRNMELEAILRSMRSAVLAVDGKDRILFCNEAFYGIAGRYGDFVGKDMRDIVDNQLILDAVEEVRRGGGTIQKEGEMRQGHTVRVTGTGMSRRSGRPGSVLLIMEDVTKIRKLERMRSDFVSNVTHELKTPLTSIKGFVDTLKQGAIDNPEYARKFLDIIDIEAERLYTLIQDILTLAEIEAGNDYHVRKCDMNRLIQDTLDLLEPKIKAKEKIQVIFEPEPGLQPFLCNPDRMKQLFINLIDNAVKNTEEGSVTVRCWEEGGRLCISVKDTGIGIPKEHLGRIFERFYRVDKGRSRKLGGTGLGLSIVKHIVEMYNGNIWLESEVGKGTEFLVEFPCTEQAKEEESPAK